MTPTYSHALIVGAGPGLSASLARKFAGQGLAVSLAAHTTGDLDDLCAETGATAHACDSASRDDVAALFAALDQGNGAPDVVVYNPSARERGPFVEIDAVGVEKALMVTAYGGFLVAQEAAKRMLPNGHGAILFTGASASVKGYAQSASFAMGKFALRGLAQSIARELSPAASAGSITRSRPAIPTARSTPTPSPRAIGTCSARTAAPGPGKSSSAPGSKTSNSAAPRLRVKRDAGHSPTTAKRGTRSRGERGGFR